MTATEDMSSSAAAGQTWTIGDVLRWTTERFAQGQEVGSPRLDAEVLLAAALGVERIRLYMDYAKPLSAAELSDYRQAVRRRLAGEPVAHVTGQREFWSLPMAVDGTVLVPRPETELLVEKALEWLRSRDCESPRAIDVGTGSGAIAIALAREMPPLRLAAVDISEAALRVARLNVARHRVAVGLLRGDLLRPFRHGGVDLVVANLPYVASAEIDSLPREVAEFDPRGALDGGPDGLEAFRRMIPQAADCLRPGGQLLLEIGAAQAAAVRVLLEQSRFVSVRVDRDLAGLDRLVSAEKPT